MARKVVKKSTGGRRGRAPMVAKAGVKHGTRYGCGGTKHACGGRKVRRKR